MLSRRALLGLGSGAVLGAVGLAVLAESIDTDQRQLRADVTGYVDALQPGSPYRSPSVAERTTTLDALAQLDAGAGLDTVGAQLASLGMNGVTALGPDADTEYRMVRSTPGSERGWGLYAYPVGLVPRLLVEVPHPNFDLYTEYVALDVLRRAPASVLAVAGAYRHDADDTADVAHEPRSLFHAVAMDIAMRHHIPQIQLHGFDDDHAPDIDVVISAGAGRATQYIRTLADKLEEADFTICRAWSEDCNNLEGKRNTQGRASASSGLTFIHLELNRTLRENDTKRDVLAQCIVENDNARVVSN